MAKTNASFNLSKSTKRVMSTILSKEQRAIFRHSMIDAEHSYIVNKNRRPRENTSSNREVPGDN